MEDAMTSATMELTGPAVETNLSRKAMLAMLQIKKWSAKKHDKRASQEVATNHNASKLAGAYRKNLLPGQSNALEDVQKACDEARTFHYQNTLPWGQDGSRILPKENYFTYVEQMRKYRHDFERAVKAFVREYPTLRDNAKNLLGTLHEEADYPNAAEIESKFRFDNVFLPFPDAKDFRVDLGDDEVSEIKSQIARQSTDAVTLAMREAWGRLHEGVSRMVERLADPDAVFRDTLVSNLTELCEVLPKLNVNDDPALAKMCDQVKEKLTARTPAELREDKGAREKTALDASSILSMMSGYMGASHESSAA
jgi:hypothetical protein